MPAFWGGGPVVLIVLCWVTCLAGGHPDCSTSLKPGGQGHPLSATNTQEAVHAQRHHLEVLFKRYGENNTISLNGLKRLLHSLGLARIRKVMVQHWEMTKRPRKSHGDRDADKLAHAQNQHADHEIPTIKKVFEAPKVTKTNLTTRKKAKDLDAYHNVYIKKDEISTTPVYTTNILLKSQGLHNLRSADYSLSQNSESATRGTIPPGAEILEPTTNHIGNLLVSVYQAPPPEPNTEMLSSKHLGLTNNSNHDQEQNPDQSHSQEQISRSQDKHYKLESDHWHENGYHHNLRLDHEECLNASSILLSHGMTREMVLTASDFSYLCPALINQIDSRSCVRHSKEHLHSRKDQEHHLKHHRHHNNQQVSSIQAAWIGGFVSVTIISLLSLLGVTLVPLMNRVFFRFLLSFLVALAVGTLSGDALLHLIPHAHGGHHHTANESHHHADGEDDLDGVWKGLTALGGVYFMFLIEHFLTLGKMYKEKKQKNLRKWDHNEDSMDAEKCAVEENRDLKPAEEVLSNHGGDYQEESGRQCASQEEEEEEAMLAPSRSPQGYSAYTTRDCENKCHSHFHDTVGQPDDLHHHHHDYHHILHHHHSQNHHPHSHSHSYSQQNFQQASVATLAWMVIMGDGLHNFSDGLAIGAAFTEGLSSGLSTSVAVFCHELPHELGDFAVLLKAGMTVKQAILYNMLSAAMAYLGMVTGILIGHYAENISMWIFALTAGLFMYVALVDMVPEMLHNDAGDHGFSHCGFFLLQNAGILLGFAIMLLIAIFEKKIQLDIQL
ncbi:hypothetical protein AGOR_G00179280 [Albula goreensis]|uniref:Zinc transporter ZIP6 n=1 Tax=Albula goreensis TaxID=1534307 RepID=A0A8T3CVM6_9TELE|nr:hypothetical protein AGOR_G00179280 [Albula goreensis]